MGAFRQSFRQTLLLVDRGCEDQRGKTEARERAS
jgi:hypothetical protein